MIHCIGEEAEESLERDMAMEDFEDFEEQPCSSEYFEEDDELA